MQHEPHPSQLLSLRESTGPVNSRLSATLLFHASPLHLQPAIFLSPGEGSSVTRAVHVPQVQERIALRPEINAKLY
jgi:hypothetical protein